MKWLDTFILAVQLLTRFPIKKEVAVKDETLTDGVIFWPVIGLITGAIQVAVYVLLEQLMPRPAAVVFTVLVQLLINGGFHLDGLCDTADGLFSARTRERMLEIMKDSRIGTNGVIAAVFDILLKIVLLNQLVHPIIPILLMPVAGKMIQGILIYQAIYARRDGLGHAYIGKINFRTLIISTAVGVVITGATLAFSGSLWLILIPFICLAAAFGFRRYIESRLGGMTGDTLGAGSEVIEILFLVLINIADTFMLI